MNLPNAVTVGRILATPVIAWLPLTSSSTLRLTAFVLFMVAGITDIVDGNLARSRKEETDLGRLLDPLADKLLLIATMIPMYVLMRSAGTPLDTWPGKALSGYFPFQTPFGDVTLAWWILAIVLGRELFMTVFRQLAARRGVIIAAIGPAKVKTGFQMVWIGASYCWFWMATVAANRGWTMPLWTYYAYLNAFVGLFTMTVAVVLTVYSFWIYLRNYGGVLTGAPVSGRS